MGDLVDLCLRSLLVHFVYANVDIALQDNTFNWFGGQHNEIF